MSSSIAPSVRRRIHFLRNSAYAFGSILAAAWVAPQCALAQAGGVWEAWPSMQLARQEVGAARIGNEVYVAGGLIDNFQLLATETVEVLDLTTLEWSFVPSMPEPRDHAAVAALDSQLYVIGGFAADFEAKDNLWIYDPAVAEWSSGPPLPDARGAAWAVAHNGRIYLFGGTDLFDIARSTTFIFDPLTNQWSTGADMPTAREHLTAAVLGDDIHVLGGRSGAATAAHERYLPATDEWEVLPPMPTARSAMGTATIGSRIVVAGGEVPQLFEVNEIYDQRTNSWSRQTDMPLPRHGVAAISLDDRILFPAGGTVQGLEPTAAVDSFAPGPTLTVLGDCPGSLSVGVTGATPNEFFGVLLSPALADSVVPPGGLCPGTELAVELPLQAVQPATANEQGEALLPIDVGEELCSSFLQLLDGASCLTSNTSGF